MKQYLLAVIASTISIACFGQLPGTITKQPIKPTGPAIIVKPGTMQPKIATETIIKSSKDNLQYAKDLVANPIEDLGTEFSPGQIMKTNQILRYKIPGTEDKYCTLKLNFWDVELFDNTNKLIWSTNMHSNQIDNLTMQTDGNLVVRDNTNNILWSTNMINASKGKLYITSDQLIIKDSTKKDSYFWSSRFGKKSWATKSNGFSLLPNQFLKLRFDTTEMLVNPNEPYSFSFSPNISPSAEENGNLKMHPVLELYNTLTHKSLWRQEVDANENAVAYMKTDGNFGIYPDINHLNTPIWETKTSGNSGSFLVIPTENKSKVYNQMFAIQDKDGITKWNPWKGISKFDGCWAYVTTKTGDDDKKVNAIILITLLSDKNFNTAIPFQHSGVISNFGVDIDSIPTTINNSIIYQVGSTHTVELFRDPNHLRNYPFYSISIDQSLNNFELNGGRIQLEFDNTNSSNSLYDIGRDHWTLDNMDVKLIFYNQFIDKIIKELHFKNVDPSRPLVKLGDEVVAGADARGIICSFDNTFNVTGYTIISIRGGFYNLDSYSY